MNYIFIHGSGQKANSWNETISYMDSNNRILCPDLSSILHGSKATYHNLYASFSKYCNRIDGQIQLCGISLGGILALHYVLDHPDKLASLVLIGTPYKVPKFMFRMQTIVFRLLPKATFKNMAFDKKDTFLLGNSMKELDFSNKVKCIKCPTFVICGEKDRANIKSAYYLSKNIQNAKLKIIENSGHVVNEDNPKLLAKILTAYDAECLSKGS